MQAGTKTIRIEDDVHFQLRRMALESGEHIYETVRRLVDEASNRPKRIKLVRNSNDRRKKI